MTRSASAVLSKYMTWSSRKRWSFKLVGSTEANSLQNKISNESPVGHALIGRKVGDVVDVETQAGMLQYKVLDIKRVD